MSLPKPRLGSSKALVKCAVHLTEYDVKLFRQVVRGPAEADET
jgi:hypothetical protein